MDDYNDDNFDNLLEAEPRLTRADVRDEVSKVLQNINTFSAQAAAGVSNAIREVSAKHPDFEQQRPRMLALLEQIPLLRDAVSSAESNPQLSPALSQMYEVTYLASKASTASTAAASSEPPKSGVSEMRPSDLSDEGTQYQAALASQRVDLSPANRKVIIAELERKGVGDIEF